MTRKYLRIIYPVTAPIYIPYPAQRKKNARSLPQILIHPQSMIAHNLEQEAYYQLVQPVIDHMLVLLNSGMEKGWIFEGFHPRWLNKAAVTKSNKNFRARVAQERRKEKQVHKLAEKLKKKVEQGIVLESATEPRTGAGCVTGARPGIYKGVQMRSQLEIRFAAELDARGIRWIYEGEAVSEANYLVDFYLPDLGVWVEVKGRFEARDKQVLPEVAHYLKTERRHRLLVYTGSGACMVVNPSGFREVERKNFWAEVIR